MSTFADIQTVIADELDRDDLGVQIDRHIRLAVKHYERRRWWFNEEQAVASTVALQANYDLPTDLLSLDWLEITINSNRHKVNEISWARYMDEYRFSSNGGVPSDWAYSADQLWLGVIPNDVYTLTLHYTRTLSPASFSSGTSNAWTNEGEELITARAMKMIGARVLGLGNDRVLAFQALEAQALSELVSMNEQRVMTGLVRPWSG